MLSSTQAEPGRKVKQQQEDISRNHVPRLFLSSAVFLYFISDSVEERGGEGANVKMGEGDWEVDNFSQSFRPDSEFEDGQTLLALQMRLFTLCVPCISRSQVADSAELSVRRRPSNFPLPTLTSI